MRTRLFCLLVLLATLASPVRAQYFVQAVFHSDGPFTARCDGSGAVLLDEGVVFIYWDHDRDGPDSTDGVIWYDLYEAPGANFHSFFLSEGGSFTSDLWRGYVGVGNHDIAIYLRIFFGDSLDSCYTSRTMTLEADAATYLINLPLAEWTCGPAPVRAPRCEMGDWVTGVFLGYELPMRPEVCLLTCRGGETFIQAFTRSPRRGELRPPVVAVTPGCDTTCRPDSSVVFNPGAWGQFGDIWFLWGVCAFHRGCARFTLLDSIPFGTLDTMIAQAFPTGVHLQWNTVREAQLDSFELWRRPPMFSPGTTVRLTTIPSSQDSSGDVYEFFDNYIPGYYPDEYNLVMIGEDGRKFAAAHAFIAEDMSVSPDNAVSPCAFALHPNYPNPFNPSTTITFDLPVTTRANVRVYDIAGREVSVLADEVLSAGTHTVTFDARSLPSGIYISRFYAGQFTAAQKMILLK